MAGDVSLNVALTLAPGATWPAIVTGGPAVQPAGPEILNLTPLAGDPVVFVKVPVTC